MYHGFISSVTVYVNVDANLLLRAADPGASVFWSQWGKLNGSYLNLGHS